MASLEATSTAAAASARRRAGRACSAGVTATATAPALSAASEPNTNGSQRRPSCHTGTAVLAIRAAVLVDRGRPANAAAGRAIFDAVGNRPVSSLTAATAVAV